jgi:uncharacterized membrane protein
MTGKPRPKRIRINLVAGLSAFWRYAVAITIVVAVSLAAWFVGRGAPTPPWITDWLVPALGWIYIVLFVIAAAYFVRKWLTRRHQTKKQQHD